MAFDPDAYLAQKNGGHFDPDAYLAAKGAPDTEPEETFLKPGYKRPGSRPFPHEELGPPIHIPTMAEGVSGALNSMADRYTFGGFGALLRAGKALGVPTTGAASDAMENYREGAPIAAAISDAPAYLEGPVQKLAEGVGGLASKGVEAIAPKAIPFVKRLGTTILTAGGTNAALNAADAALRGAD